MSLRTTERLLITSGLALMLAAGCGDGDKPPDVDNGGGGTMDAGRDSGGGGGRDTGTDPAGPSITCGTLSCTGTKIQQTTINPCCVPDSNVCGLNADDLRRANSSTPFTGCIPKDVPAAVEKSVYCGEFWDQVEMAKRDNGGLDIPSGSVTLTFEGCCLGTGECGAMITTPRGQDEDVLNTHLGCVSFGRLQTAFAAEDAGPMEQPANPPFCNVMTGEAVMATDTLPGIPKFVCGCGMGKIYDPADKTRTFPCVNNLPTSVCGRDEPTSAQLAMLPEFVCGCTTDAKLPCMVGVDKAVCGTKQIDANSEELARIPSFICGGGDNPPASALPTLKGVAPAVCGKKTPEASDLAAVPQFICGEMNNPDTSSLPKLKNLPATTCGTLAIASGSPFLAEVPEFVCGCRANSRLPCLRNVQASVCGAKQIDATSPQLTEIPEYICGCGADVVDPGTGLTCMSRVENNVCGGKLVQAAAELAQVPEVLCGCGDGVIAARCLPNVPMDWCGAADATASLAGLPDFLCGCGDGVRAVVSGVARPCLNNIPKEQCGALDVAATTATYLPASLCGCGPTVTYDPANAAFTSPCLSKTAYNECGGGTIPTSDPNNTPSNTADDCFTNQSSFVRGCGEGVAENTPARTCLPNGKATMFGCNYASAGPTIAGRPKYACGCGVGVMPTRTPAECLPNTATTACGSVDPTSAELAQLPTYLCGCGVSIPSRPSASVSLPCLSYLPTTTCGAGSGAVNTGYLAQFPGSLCGCGASLTYNPASAATTPVPCLSNQATTVCGTQPVPVTDRAAPLPDCYTGWPEYVRGCGTGTTSTYPPTCVPNAANTMFGCTNITADVAGQPTILCGCGENVVASGPCLPNVGTQYCGSTAALNTPFVTSLPANLCGCGSTSTTWDPSNAAFTAGPCISKTIGATCGGATYCTIGATGTPCSDTQTCQDLRGGTGAGPYGVGGIPTDGRGDTCVP